MEKNNKITRKKSNFKRKYISEEADDKKKKNLDFFSLLILLLVNIGLLTLVFVLGYVCMYCTNRLRVLRFVFGQRLDFVYNELMLRAIA